MTAQLHRFFVEYLTVNVDLHDLDGDKIFVSLVLDWFYMSKNTCLASFWMVFKSRVLFCLRSPKSVETPKSKRKQVPASWAEQKEDIPCENARES